MFRKWRPGGFLSFLFTKKKCLYYMGLYVKHKPILPFLLRVSSLGRQEKWQADWQADDD